MPPTSAAHEASRMKVLFGYSPTSIRDDGSMYPFAIYWRDEEGDIHEYVVRTDGSTADRIMLETTLSQIITYISSSHYWMCPVEVPSLQIGLMLLGTWVDLPAVFPIATLNPLE